MQKRRFDLSQLGNNLRDRAGRLRNIQSLGNQANRLRRTNVSFEYIVPILAFLILAVALILSYWASSSAKPGNQVAVGISATASPMPSGGTIDAQVPTPVVTGAGVLTGTGEIAGGYPGLPTEGPIPVLPPGGEGFPDTGSPITDTALPLGAETAVAPPPDFGQPQVPTSGDTGYPPPATSGNPDTGTLPGQPQIPTDLPPVNQPDTNPPPDFPPPDTGVVPTAEPNPPPADFPPTEAFPTETAPVGSYPPPPTSAPAEAPTDQTSPVVPPEESPIDGTSEPGATESPVGTPGPGTTPVAGQPTSTPVAVTPSATPLPSPTITPTPVPVNRIDGNVRWTQSQSPIIVDRNYVVTTGSSLQIDPGVEVRIKPGQQFYIEGTLHAVGSSAAPVRFVGVDGRWDTLIGQPGSNITLEHTEIRNGGRGGVALSSTSGQLTMRDVLLTDSGGGVVTSNSGVDIRGTQIIGNDLPDGPALVIQMNGAAVTLRESIFGGNRLPGGTPQVRIAAPTVGSGPLDIQGNAFENASGTLLELQAAAAMGGTIRCNGFRGGAIGLALNASTPSAQNFNLSIENNAYQSQANYGIASTIALNAANNWWGDPSGPADAQRNPQGKGVRAGVNVTFAPPLQARPGCSPQP